MLITRRVPGYPLSDVKRDGMSSVLQHCSTFCSTMQDNVC